MFVSGDLRLELFPGKSPRLDFTLKITEEQAKGFVGKFGMTEALVGIIINQNMKFPNSPVRLERANFEFPFKGGYFGRIICVADRVDFPSSVNLRQTLTKIRKYVVEVSGSPFLRNRS